MGKLWVLPLIAELALLRFVVQKHSGRATMKTKLIGAAVAGLMAMGGAVSAQEFISIGTGGVTVVY